MRNLTVEKMNRERELEEKQHRRWRLFVIFVEACWIALLICGCAVFFQVISAHAEEAPAVIYMNAEQAQADAIDIDEAPPINRISEDLDEQDANGHQLVYLGEFKLTYYCPCRKCNGSNGAIDRLGNPLVWGTVAVDPKVIPLGTQLVIDGYDAIFTARDTGDEWVQGHHIDIFVPVSHKEALAMCTEEHRKVWRWTE